MHSRSHANVLVISLVLLVVLVAVPTVLASPDRIRITGAEPSPSRVKAGGSVTVRISIEYDFSREWRIAATIYDVDASKVLFDKDPISESLKGTGEKTYSIQLTAGQLEKIWKLRAFVGVWEFQETGKWTFVAKDFQVTIFTKVSLTIETDPVLNNLEITVDGTSIKTGSDGKLRKDDFSATMTHRIGVPAEFALATGSKAIFVKWSDGSSTTTKDVPAPDQDVTLTAKYKIQHFLTVKSEYDSPKGDGWYDEKSSATFSVDSSVPAEGILGSLGGKRVFDRWTGDSSATTAEARITMDEPKTVTAEWRTDNTMPYIIIGAIGAAVIIIVALLFLMRRRKAPAPAPAYQPSPPLTVAPPPPQPPVAPAPAVKFCINCGAPLPVQVQFCNKCGSKQ